MKSYIGDTGAKGFNFIGLGSESIFLNILLLAEFLNSYFLMDNEFPAFFLRFFISSLEATSSFISSMSGPSISMSFELVSEDTESSELSIFSEMFDKFNTRLPYLSFCLLLIINGAGGISGPR